jgi:hypothetical protein
MMSGFHPTYEGNEEIGRRMGYAFSAEQERERVNEGGQPADGKSVQFRRRHSLCAAALST